MTVDKPLISVIIPCYNHAKFIDECLQSVLNQSYKDWECIIVSDGSTDNTAEIAGRWVEKHTKFRYFFQENSGPSAARNLGIENANGNWILPLDADNHLHPNYMQNALQYFANLKLKLIYGQVKKFGTEMGIWVLPEFNLSNLASCNMIENCSFFKKSDWESVGGYDERLIHGYEDWEFWISILKNGGEIKKMDTIAVYYRVTGDSRSNSLLQHERLDETLKYIEKKHFDFFSKYFPNWHHCRNEQYIYKNKYQKISKNIFGKIIIKVIDIFSK